MKGYLFDQAFYSGEDGDAAQHARIVKRGTVADKTTRRCAYTHAFGHDFSSLRVSLNQGIQRYGHLRHLISAREY
jgi:hypothetical protein